jgi:serine/threonine protein kinase
MTERTLFLAALERSDPAERAKFLDEACGDDLELRRRVEKLLEDDEEAGHFLEPPSALVEAVRGAVEDAAKPTEGPGATAPYVTQSDPPQSRPLTEGPGTWIGPYKLLQKIGEGGMGVVYMAEQETPVRRRVALKVIKPGMDTDAVIARFEAERQALAMMDHPNIAKVLDAGATVSGRPFFVMEIVPGLPITQYCDRNQLTPRERLELFVPVCQAIQHAHHKGIIHRDIKPSNVIVTMIDGSPAPKVIDFGVAKAIHQRLTERTMFTQFGAAMGTPEYMSPEQAGTTGLDIDTRSDIYSLGVLLYELLTGTTPLQHVSLQQAALDEVLRRVREEEPPKPSARLSDSHEMLASISARRRTEPSRLTKLLRGELDWIVMKALEKDRTRRYETANGFARDVERYLHDEPVEASPPSATYRLRKFARKHRVALVTAGAFMMVLLLAAAVSTWQAIVALEAEARATKEAGRARAAEQRALEQTARAVAAEQEARTDRDRAVASEKTARSEADKSRTVNDFLTQDILIQAEPENNDAKDKVTLLDVLDRAADKVGSRFRDQPELEAMLRGTIAETYHGLGSFAKAERQAQVWLDLDRRLFGDSSTETLFAFGQLGHQRYHLGRYVEAIELLRQAVEGLESKLGPDHLDTLTCRNNLAIAYQAASRTEEAIMLHEATLKLRESKLGPDHPRTLESRNNLAVAYVDVGRTSEARRSRCTRPR